MAVNGVEIEVGQTWVTAGGATADILHRSVDGFQGQINGRTFLWDHAGRAGFNDRARLVRLAKITLLREPVRPQVDVEAFGEAQFNAERLRELGVAWATSAPSQADMLARFAATGRRGTDPKPDANATQVGGSHYKVQQIQPWDFIAANGIGFLAGNVIKYVARFDKKNGVEDLKKARHYLDKLIELEQAK